MRNTVQVCTGLALSWSTILQYQSAHGPQHAAWKTDSTLLRRRRHPLVDCHRHSCVSTPRGHHSRSCHHHHHCAPATAAAGYAADVGHPSAIAGPAATFAPLRRRATDSRGRRRPLSWTALAAAAEGVPPPTRLPSAVPGEVSRVPAHCGRCGVGGGGCRQYRRRAARDRFTVHGAAELSICWLPSLYRWTYLEHLPVPVGLKVDSTH